MGPKVTSSRLTFVSFELKNGAFVALIPMEGLISVEGDPELLLRQAAKLYERSIITMRLLVGEIHTFRKTHIPTPARKIWQLGNAIFGLCEDLDQLSLQIDGFYGHLVRDLGVKRKWLEKVIIFRRYLPEDRLIPESLNWGRCEKGTRKVAEQLRDGRLTDGRLSQSSVGPLEPRLLE